MSKHRIIKKVLKAEPDRCTGMEIPKRMFSDPFMLVSPEALAAFDKAIKKMLKEQNFDSGKLIYGTKGK